jgi:hypothetical protein
MTKLIKSIIRNIQLRIEDWQNERALKKYGKAFEDYLIEIKPIANKQYYEFVLNIDEFYCERVRKGLIV